MSSYRSRSAELAARFAGAVDAGLVAAGETFKTEVKRQLAPGYTSGAFVTGHVLGSVTRTEPSTVGGVRVLHVGTNVDYAMYWELGHQNLFMRRFAQKEVWGPAIQSTRDAQLDAFRRAFASAMASGALGATGPVSEAAD